MDHAMEIIDEYALDYVYDSLGDSFPAVKPYTHRQHILRQATSCYWVAAIGAIILYLIGAYYNWYYVFNKELLKHPKFKPNQVRLEMSLAIPSLFMMSLVTLPMFIADVRGYAKFYRNVDDYGIPYLIMSCFTFLLFTDMFVYWIHRGLHWGPLYKYIHKPHHRWLVSTPFASHAFHPLDGVAQSLPYHIYGFLFPMHSFTWIFMFFFVNCWTISIHDGNHFSKSKILNTTAHHSIHHRDFNYNYGQYFTLWDRIGGTYRPPEGLDADNYAPVSKKED